MQKRNKNSRKERSENRLTELGIKYNPNLPVTIENNSSNIRSAKEIASKIVALWEVVNAAQVKDSSRQKSIEFLKDVELWDSLSPLDQEFLTKEKHTKQKIINMSWRTEVLKVLYWALGELSSLGIPEEEGRLSILSDKVNEKYGALDPFLNQTKLRSKEEILDESDFIYRLHWCSKRHRREEQHVPPNYNYSVIVERDFALRWLTDPELNWDDVSLDT